MFELELSWVGKRKIVFKYENLQFNFLF